MREGPPAPPACRQRQVGRWGRRRGTAQALQKGQGEGSAGPWRRSVLLLSRLGCREGEVMAGRGKWAGGRGGGAQPEQRGGDAGPPAFLTCVQGEGEVVSRRGGERAVLQPESKLEEKGNEGKKHSRPSLCLDLWNGQTKSSCTWTDLNFDFEHSQTSPRRSFVFFASFSLCFELRRICHQLVHMLTIPQ